MKIIEGKYTNAIVYSDTAEESALSQVKVLCDQPWVKDSKIRMMPDIHAGKGCTIGTTMKITGDAICPNLVGVDISCGILVIQLKEKRINLPELDSCIHKLIPAGMNIREKTHKYARDTRIAEIYAHIDYMRGQRSIGTLGGGNHFIEIDKDDEDNLYLVIHTGSRNIGKQVAEYYQKIAYRKQLAEYKLIKDNKIEELKSQNKEVGIETFLQSYRKLYSEPIYDLAYLEGNDVDKYFHDMRILEEYAKLNREAIAEVIISAMNFHIVDQFHTIHNYIDIDNMILRKGAVSAQKGEHLIIPMNMRDGSLICTGKGNPEWNYSAPHGAGRLMSRKKAFDSFTVSAFKESMKGIYTTSVNSGTLDECPMVYKPMEEIISQIYDTVEIVKVIKPIYNFKASEELRKRVR